MADIRTLKENYLRDAASNGRTTLAQQIDYLEAERQKLSPDAGDGDWAVTSTSANGRSSQHERGATATERLKAIIAALKQLEAQNGNGDSGGTGQLLGFRIKGIHA